MPELRIKFDRHGLGDCVHFAHALQLYKRRGYDITVQAEENKLFLWKVAGVNIVQGGDLPDHPYLYPPGFDDLTQPDCETNKVAFGLRHETMPPLDVSPEQAWEELCNVRLSAHDFIPREAHAEAEAFLEGLPRPIICFHSRGTNWHERKSLSTELAFDVILQLLDQTSGSVVVLDYDRRAPMVGDARCKGIKPTWGHIGVDRLCALYERSDLMIGVDSGPFHVAALTNIKTLGIFRSLHPVRVCLPNPNATYLISTNHIHAWDIRRHKWAFSTYDGTDPTLAAITDAVISTLTMRDPAMEIREEHLPTMNEVSGRYIYRRKAYDEREMELLPDGRIGEGAAGCEQRWSLRFSDGAILIDISGKNGIICSASRIGDGFYGQWTQFEKMPVELIRIRDKQDLIYTSGLFSTRFTTARDFASPWYAVWKDRLSLGDRIHRKGWEIASVCETLSSAGVLKVGNAGIGFGVGSELLPTVFAGFGCRILATDALPESWKNTTGRFYDVNQSNGVEIRVVDMNAINGGELTASIEESAFDFSWSICSMDHCGSTWLTKRFLLNQMNCLKPGGISAHTAEYSIGVGMPRVGDTVWFTWDDIVDVRHLMTALGYELAPIDWFCGDSIEDHMIDESPYVGRVHIKCEALGQWGTCVLFAAKKVTSNVFWVPFDEEDGRAAIADFQRSHSQT